MDNYKDLVISLMFSLCLTTSHLHKTKLLVVLTYACASLYWKRFVLKLLIFENYFYIYKTTFTIISIALLVKKLQL